MKRERISRLVACLLVLSLLFGFTGCSLFPDSEQVSIPPLKTPKPLTYEYFKVERADLTKGVSGVGKVTSIYYTTHAFTSAGGKVKALYVSLGDYVKKGDRLIELDNSSLELEFLQSEISYEQSKLNYDTYTKQHDRNEISDTQYKVYTLQFQAVEKSYKSLKTAYENTVLYAKVSGKVVYINTAYTSGSSEGKAIVAGETMIAIDSEDSKYIFVVFDRDTTATATTPQQFRIGTKLTLNRHNNSGEEGSSDKKYFTGTIVGTDQIVKDTGVGYVSSASYYCKMEDAPSDISVGESIKYNYIEEEVKSCLQIPTSAYYQFGDKKYVYVIDASTKLKKEVYIQTGLETDTRVEVLSGLSEGDLIVLN